MEPCPLQKPRRTFYLDIARAFAIISITCNHAINRCYQNYHGQSSEFLAIPLISTLFKAVVTVFSRVGVPLFLMITAVLILSKRMEKASDIKRFYKHNLLSLFITAEIWYVLIYWFLLLFSPDSTLQAEGWGRSILGMFETMLLQNQVTFDGMWYIPMILCLYLFLPFVAMVKNQLSGSREKAVYLPAVVIFAVTMVLPFLNNLLLLLGKESYLCAIEDVNLPIFYYLYILVGYLVGKGALKGLRTGTVAAVTVGLFLICCGFQLWAYARPVDYLVAYDFPLMPFLAGFLFELLRRSEGVFRRLQKPIVRLSRISFGIYFLHIVIMTTLVKLLGDFQITLLPPVRFLVLEVVSVGLSILIIAPLSKIKLLRRYLFLIK